MVFSTVCPIRWEQVSSKDPDHIRAATPPGFINIEASMGGKWLQLLKEVAPQVTRVTTGVFHPATAPQADYYRRAVDCCTSIGDHTKTAPVGDMRAIESEIAGAAQDRGAGLTVLPDTYTFTYRDQIVSLANRARSPAVYPFTPFADAADLLPYGIDLADLQPPCRSLCRCHLAKGQGPLTSRCSCRPSSS